jgi:hypothetical protein
VSCDDDVDSARQGREQLEESVEGGFGRVTVIGSETADRK